MSDSNVQKRLELANVIAKSAGQLTLNYFQTDRFDVIRKGDGSPLTIADQEAETFLRQAIQEAYPDDAIVGEEFGESAGQNAGQSEYTWILDPIDGTKSFISGVPLYGTMVAVEKATGENEPRQSVLGSVYFPGLDVGIYASRGQGAWSFQGDHNPIAAKVSQTSSLTDAVMVTSEVETFSERSAADVYQKLSEAVYFSRTWGDAYGYYLVATGKVEIMINPILDIWDAAAVQPIIEEAGGKFTDWAGVSRIDAGESIGTNGQVHDQVVALTEHLAGVFKGV